MHNANTAGNYFLEIMGECDIIRTETSVITSLDTYINVKWGDMLYVENSANKYQRFQRYQNNAEKFIYLYD